jgi:hypothetical protein
MAGHWINPQNFKEMHDRRVHWYLLRGPPLPSCPLYVFDGAITIVFCLTLRLVKFRYNRCRECAGLIHTLERSTDSINSYASALSPH